MSECPGEQILFLAGSIIADFKITVVANIKAKDLLSKSIKLANDLSATLVLESEGIIQLRIPKGPVPYNSQQNVICLTNEETLETESVWQLRRKEYFDGPMKRYDITTGRESEVKQETKTPETTVHLKNVSELWAGEYTCTYQQNTNTCTIFHKASGKLDVCLLPNIDITTTPSFPRCTKSSDFNLVKVKCEIKNSYEKYKVMFSNGNTVIDASQKSNIYEAKIFVGCNSETPKLTCTFSNRGIWDQVVSMCVNLDLNSVLESAMTADIGLGTLEENAAHVFNRLQNVTNKTESINTFANVDASVQVLSTLSGKLRFIHSESSVNDVLESSSNLLDKSLDEDFWQKKDVENNMSMAERYLNSVEHLINIANVTEFIRKTNVEVNKTICTQGSQCTNTVSNVSVSVRNPIPDSIKTARFTQLETYLPNEYTDHKPNSMVVSTTTENGPTLGITVEIRFPLLIPRPPNVQLECVSWDNNTGQWSNYGCYLDTFITNSNEGHCICTHLSSFAILMSKNPLEVNGLNEITHVGLSISVVSLIIVILIELIVWSAVVKTNSLYLRHTAHINISLCLLIADCCFLASSEPKDISDILCKTAVVLKHFCYLSMFFWMLCLSATLLHQTVYVFHGVSKKNYLRFSLVLGYVCPLLIVTITFLTSNAGAEGVYFSKETCWLVYKGGLNGSMLTFVIPVGIIVFVNVFSMLVVIMKLLAHPMNTEKSYEKERTAAKTVMRSVILLTPIFGITWIFGFAVLIFDLTYGPIAFVVNYAFTLLNSFQGLFILLTTCLGEKLTRDALLNRFRKNAPASTTDSSTKLDSTWRK
ncbi:hypothetical protein PAMP_005974 [Pampus punctatissimus]